MAFDGVVGAVPAYERAELFEAEPHHVATWPCGFVGFRACR